MASSSKQPHWNVATQKRVYPPTQTALNTPAAINTYAETSLEYYTSQLPQQYFSTLLPSRFSFVRPYAFLTKPFLLPVSFTDDFLWFLWCLITVHTIAIEFDPSQILGHLNDDDQCESLLWTFFEWFEEIPVWREILKKLIADRCCVSVVTGNRRFTQVFIFNRRYFRTSEGRIYTENIKYNWRMIQGGINGNCHIRDELLHFLCRSNDQPLPPSSDLTGYEKCSTVTGVCSWHGSTELTKKVNGQESLESADCLEALIEKLQKLAPIKPPSGYRWPLSKEDQVQCHGGNYSESDSEDDICPWLYDDCCLLHTKIENGTRTHMPRQFD